MILEESWWRGFQGRQGRLIRVVGEVTTSEVEECIEFFLQTDASFVGRGGDGMVGGLPSDHRGPMEEAPVSMRISLGAIDLEGEFGPQQRLEFRFNPAAIKGEAELVVLLRVMSTLGRLLGRETEMMDLAGRTLFRYRPGGDGVGYVGEGER